MYFIISAGFTGGQAIDVLNYSAKSATASLADQATVADALTSMMNAYKDSNVSAAHAANDLTKIEIYGKAQLSAFAGSLGFTMVTAHAAGISIDEASAAVSTLSQVSGNHGIRRISNEFDNLARSLLDVDHVAKRAKAGGFQFDEASFTTMTFIEKLQYLQKITGALSSNINDETYSMMKNMDATTDQLGATAKLDLQLDKANSSFMKLTGGAAAFIPAAILLSGKATEYNKILGHMHEQTDMVTDAFDTMRGTTAQQFKMLEITVQNLAIVIGLHLLPVINGLLTPMIHIGRAIVEWTSQSANIDILKTALMGIGIVVAFFVVPPLTALAITMWPIVLAITGIVAGGTLLGIVIRALVDHLGGMTTILQATKLHLDQAFTNPAVRQAMQQLRQAFTDLQPALQFIGAILGGVIAAGFGILLGVIRGIIAALPGLLTFFGGIVNFVGGIVRVIKDILTLNFSDIGAALGQIGQGILQVFQGLLGGAVGWVQGFVQSVIGFFLLLWDKLTGHSIVPDMVRDIVAWFGKLPGMIGAIFGRILAVVLENLQASGIGQAIGPLLASFGQLFGQLQRFGQDVLLPLGAAFLSLAKTIGGALWVALQGVWSAIQPLLPVFRLLAIAIGVLLYSALAVVVGILRGVAQGLAGVVTFISSVVTVVAGIIRLITDIFTGKWNDILPALGAIGRGLYQMFVGALQAVWGFVLGFLEGLLGMFGVKTHAIEAFFTTAWDNVRNGVSRFFSWLGQALANALGNALKLPIIGPAIKLWVDEFTFVRQVILNIGSALGGLWSKVGGFDGIIKAVGAAFLWVKDRAMEAAALITQAWNSSGIGGAIQSLVTSLKGLWPSIEQLGKGLWNVIQIIGNLFATLGKQVGGQLMTAFGAIGTALSVLWSVLSPVLSKLMEVLVSIGRVILSALGGALSKLWSVISPLLPVLKTLATIVGVVLYTAFAAIVGIIVGVAKGLVGVINVISGVITFISGIFRLIGDILSGNWKDVVPALKQIWSGVVQIITGALETVWGFITGFLEGLLGMFGVKTKDIEAFFPKLWDNIRNGVGRFFSWLGGKANDFKEMVGGWFSGLGSFVKEKLDGLGSTVGGWIAGLGQFKDKVFAAVKSWWDGAVRVVEDFFTNIKDAFTRFAVYLFQHNVYFRGLVEHILWIIAWVRAKFNQIKGVFQVALAQIEARFTEVWDSIRNGVGGFFSWLGTQVNEKFQFVKTFFAEALKFVETTFTTAWDNVRNGVGGFFNWLGTQANAKFQFVKKVFHVALTLIEARFMAAWDTVRNGVGSFFNWLGTQVNQKFQFVKKIFQEALALIEARFMAAWDAVRNGVGRFFSWLGTQVNQKIELVKALFQEGLDRIHQKFQQILDAVRALVQPWVQDRIKDFENLKTLAMQKFEELKTKAIDLFIRIKDEVGRIVTEWKDNIIKLIQDLIGNIMQKLGFDGTAVTQAKDAIGRVMNAIADTVSAIAGQAFNWGAHLIQQFVDGLKSKIDDVKKAVGDIAKTIGDHFPHSPAKTGPLREAPTWGPTLMQQFTGGMLSQEPLVRRVASAMAQAATLDGSASFGLSGGAGSGSLALVGGGGGATYITANFPNATDKQAIKDAFAELADERERDNYRLARRAGGYRDPRYSS